MSFLKVHEEQEAKAPPSSSCGLPDDYSDADGLPMAGDYVGLGGPDAVPLETEGPFVPQQGTGGLLDDLFLNPDVKQLDSLRRAHRVRFM